MFYVFFKSPGPVRNTSAIQFDKNSPKKYFFTQNVDFTFLNPKNFK